MLIKVNVSNTETRSLIKEYSRYVSYSLEKQITLYVFPSVSPSNSVFSKSDSFLNISVGIWRDMTCKNVEELIHEAKEAGNYDLWKDELDADLERVKYFRTIKTSLNGQAYVYFPRCK